MAIKPIFFEFPDKVWEDTVYVALIHALHSIELVLVLGAVEDMRGGEFTRNLMAKALRRAADTSEANSKKLGVAVDEELKKIIEKARERGRIMKLQAVITYRINDIEYNSIKDERDALRSSTGIGEILSVKVQKVQKKKGAKK